MLVTDVTISDPRFESETGRHVAVVGLSADSQITSFQCAVLLPEDTPPPSRDIALMNEAIRQMRRMPEYRRGDIVIDLASGVTPRQG